MMKPTVSLVTVILLMVIFQSVPGGASADDQVV